MRLLYAFLLACLATAGCSPRPASVPADASAMAATGSADASVSAVSVSYSEPVVVLKAQPTNYAKSFGQVWEQENALIKSHPGFVKHVGDRMDVYHNGEKISDEPQFCKDCDGFTPYFAGTVQLRSRVSGQIEPYAVVAEIYAEDTLFAVPYEHGRLGNLTGMPLASPDGRWIASGDYEEHGEGGAWGEYVLTITDWTGKVRPVEFGPICRPNAWNDNNHFTALCVDISDFTTSFEALAARNPKGEWTLTVTRLIEVTGYGVSVSSFRPPTAFAGRAVAPQQ